MIDEGQKALAKCSVANSTSGTCEPYPSDGICARFFPNNSLVFVPVGVGLDYIEKMTLSIIESAVANANLLGPDCLAAANELTCLTRFYPCGGGTSPGDEAFPLLPCASMCADFWSTCYSVQKINYQEGGLSSDISAQGAPNCLGMRFSF